MQDDFKKLLLIVITSAFSLSVLSCAARDHDGNWEGKTSQEKTFPLLCRTTLLPMRNSSTP